MPFMPRFLRVRWSIVVFKRIRLLQILEMKIKFFLVLLDKIAFYLQPALQAKPNLDLYASLK